MKYRLGVLTLLVASIGLWGQGDNPNRLARACYQQATRYYNHPNQTDYTDSLAFLFYNRALRYASAGPATAQLRFDCHQKIGIYHQTFDRQSQALRSYRQAIAICQNEHLSDSLLFVPYLYVGTVHYQLQTYDSTMFYLERAESLFRRYRGVPEVQRLYNMLGIVYHESGNYRQSINYFQKALQLQLANKQIDSSAVYSYKSNIATALRNIHQYDSAAAIYKSLLPLTDNPDKLYTNLGLVYLSKHQPGEALAYLEKVKIDTLNRIVVQNALAETYLQQARLGEATAQLNETIRFTTHGPPTRAKDPQLGLTYKLLGDIASQQRRYETAIRYYQQSIIRSNRVFRSTDVFQNPQQFTQGFSNYRLFESLLAKADCWRFLHRQRPQSRHREAALNTYQAAFRLADYIEKSFDNEEARLFTVEKVYPIYQQAISFLVQAHQETGSPVYLEEAFRWSERSKAAVLAISLKENTIKPTSGIPDSLLSQERNLRVTLSRLLLKLENAAAPQEIASLTAQLRDTELILSRLAESLHDYPDYYRQKFSFDSLSISQLQRQVLSPETALLSYFRADTAMYGFVLTNSQLHYFRVPGHQSLDLALRGLLMQLRTVAPGRAYGGEPYAESLYDKLIRPADPYLTGVRSLIVIPHDELAQLPFEVLHNYQRVPLLERFDVTYQYAASFLQSQFLTRPKPNQILAVAPFAGAKSSAEFELLNASQAETSQLGGMQLVNRNATKANFLHLAGDYPVIHLATHAVADNTDPTRSFVAFYPTSYASNRLYAHEISYGTLSKTQLVFLSACETASGKLIRGEGVMSLSRAFSIAGCPNLITSLWKAEDNATAYISNRFYGHLRAGMSYAKALQQAKLDLLHDQQQVQFHSPQYWSHLVYIGTPPRTGQPWSVWLLAALGLPGLGWVAWQWTRRRGHRR